MKNVMLALSILFVSMTYAFSSDIVLDAHEGQGFEIKVADCKAGYYGAFAMSSADTTNTLFNQRPNSRTIQLADKVTAYCYPKTCEYRYFLTLKGWMGSITVFPGSIKMGEYQSTQATKDALKKFLSDGTCAVSRKYVPAI